MVMGRALLLACIGGAIGIGAGYLAGLSFRAVLAGINPADFAAIAGALAVAIVMVLAGSVWPAIRAARISPLEATRAE
jgi:putative ABC transport system permease protein